VVSNARSKKITIRIEPYATSGNGDISSLTGLAAIDFVLMMDSKQ